MLRHAHFCIFDPAGFGGTYAERERFNSAVFVAPDKSFLFVKNEKCGSNTARMTLQRAAASRELPANFKDANRWLAPLLQPSDLDLQFVEDINAAAKFKFAVVRNPYSRLLSAWLDKFAQASPKRAKFERRLGAAAPTFGEFVERVSAQSPQDMDPHWRVQHHNIYADRIGFDRFVKFEALEAGLAEVMAQFGKATPASSVRKGQHEAGARIAAHYTSDIARKVADTFAIDFATFGYSAELAAA